MRNLLKYFANGRSGRKSNGDQFPRDRRAADFFGKHTDNSGLGLIATADYWTRHNVTSHRKFANAAESLDYFHWRNDQYFGYIDLLPVLGQDGKTVLDFGCGPGHDLVGFGLYSKPERLVGADLSSSSLAEAKLRLDLHGIDAELLQLEPDRPTLPFPDHSFDYIHSSGVLHHTPDPVAILREFRRILKPGGSVRVMVYNHNSLWLHLYVAYQRTLVQGLYPDRDLGARFRCSTDGEDCPISNCYTPTSWLSICESAGFSADFLGVAISMFEMTLLDLRFPALMDPRLPSQHREFLLALKFDEYGYPVFEGHRAGIDACYRLVVT